MLINKTSNVFSLISEIIKESENENLIFYYMVDINCYSDYYMDTTYCFYNEFDRENALLISEKLHGNKIYFDISYRHDQEGYEQFNLKFEYSLENGKIENANYGLGGLIERLKNICYLVSRQIDKLNDEIK